MQNPDSISSKHILSDTFVNKMPHNNIKGQTEANLDTFKNTSTFPRKFLIIRTNGMKSYLIILPQEKKYRLASR